MAIKKIAAVLLFFGFAVSPARGAEEPTLQSKSGVIDALRGKIALEAQIEDRISSMLKSYLKTEDVSVIVKVNLLLSKQKEDKGSSMRRWDAKEEIVLPGVPAGTSMTKDSQSGAGVGAVRIGISNINIWIMTGKQLSKEREAAVKKLISDALDLSPEAGDVISVQKMAKEFNLLDFSSWKIDPWIVTAAAALILLGVFLYGPLRAFLKKLNENISGLGAAKNAPAEGAHASGGTVSAAEAALSAELSISGAGGSGGTSVLTFDSSDTIPLEKYVNKDNVEDLAIILENEPPEVIAKVVQHLPPKLAFSAIPKFKMNDVIEQFFKREYEEPETVKTLLNRIRDKMAGSFGGEGRLSRLIQVMDRKNQKAIMTFVRSRNVVFAANLERYFFRFTDLLCYDEASLRRIFRKSGVDPFARCLKICDETVQQSFFDMLGPAIRDLINARMQNIMHVADASDSELAILKSVEVLSANGLILSLLEAKQVGKAAKAESAAAAPAAAPAAKAAPPPPPTK